MVAALIVFVAFVLNLSLKRPQESGIEMSESA